MLLRQERHWVTDMCAIKEATIIINIYYYEDKEDVEGCLEGKGSSKMEFVWILPSIACGPSLLNI